MNLGFSVKYIIANMQQESTKLNECKSNNENIQKTLYAIKSLPDDVMRMVYEDYFECKKECDIFIKMLYNESSTRLEYKLLYDASKKLLDAPCAVEYLRKKSKSYDWSYTEHFINKRNVFKRVPDVVDSFNLTILMSLHH